MPVNIIFKNVVEEGCEYVKLVSGLVEADNGGCEDAYGFPAHNRGEGVHEVDAKFLFVASDDQASLVVSWPSCW